MTPDADPAVVVAHLADARDPLTPDEMPPTDAPSSEAQPTEATQAEVGIPEGSPPGTGDVPSAPVPASSAGRWRHVASLAVAGCVVLALVAGVVLRSPLFRARHVQVRGAIHLTRADVLRIAGIAAGTNVATFDAGAAERRLEGDPWVEGAAIAKQLPSTLVVVVRERHPVAVAEIGGAPRLVASDGTLLDVAVAAELLPRIAADATAPALTTASVRGAARAIAAMSPGLRRTVAQVAVLADGELRVDLTSGARVTYGPAVDLTAKAQALRALLAYAARGGTTVASADVQVPTAPTARLVAGAPASP